MDKDKKMKNYIISGILIAVAILFTVLVKFVNVKPVGVKGTNIGFAFINRPFADLIGSNMTLYNITEWLGIIPILVVMVYGLIGLKQLVKTKNVFKVDKEILILGGFYVVVAVLYVFFEKCIINYRPVLIEGVLEASYPSSHTLMAMCFCGSAIVLNKRYFEKHYKIINIVLAVVMGLIVIGRLLSGVHWLTDIIGGSLISGALIMTYYSLIYEKKYKLKDRTKKKTK